MEIKSNKTFWSYFVVLLLLNTIYFFIYFYLLGFDFRWLNFLFIFATTSSYIILLSLFRYRWIHFIIYFFFFGLLLFALINFAFYQVFGVFLNLSLNQASQVNFNLISFLKDFVYLVPTGLFVVTLIFYGSIVFASRKYSEKINTKHEQYNFLSSQVDMYSSVHIKPHQILKYVVAFCLINVTVFMVVASLFQMPKENWWKVENMLADLGYWGHLYSQVYAKVEGPNESKVEEFAEKEAVTIDIEKQVGQNEPEEIVDYFAMKVKDLYLLNGSSTYEKASVVVPKFKTQPNIIIVQLESLPSWIINFEPSAMPYLKSLMQDNISVDTFHANSCQTINAEFSSLCSYWPDVNDPINYSHQDKDYRCLPSILSEDYDYETYFLHADEPGFWDRNVMMPKWGFENNYFVPFFTHKLDDRQFFAQCLDVVTKSKKPFFAYLTTFTGHAPHNQEQIDYQLTANDNVITRYQGELDKRFKNIVLDEDELRAYHGFAKSVDEAIKYLMERLEKNGLLKNTIIFIYNDHRYYNFKGDELTAFNYYNESPFAMILPDQQKGEIQKIASHVDITPTILNLVEGDKYVPRDRFIGQSLFASDFSNQVLNKCLGRVYYLNQDSIVVGNYRSSRYHFLQNKRNLCEDEKQELVSWLELLVQKSDGQLYNNLLLD